MLAWVRGTPLGLLVVPLVWRKRAVEPGSGGVTLPCEGAGAPSCSIRTPSSPAVALSEGTPSERVASQAAPVSGSRIATSAPASSMKETNSSVV